LEFAGSGNEVFFACGDGTVRSASDLGFSVLFLFCVIFFLSSGVCPSQEEGERSGIVTRLTLTTALPFYLVGDRTPSSCSCWTLASSRLL
jgi:hypothetical protein